MTSIETSTPELGKRGAGRPRNPELEQRIKRVALEILAAYGFSGLTLEKICTKAGVPRATFYRRWATPVGLVSEAFNERFETGVLEITGNLHADLAVFSARLVALYNDPVLGPCLLFITPESKLKPELTAAMAEAEQSRRRRNIAELERALQNGGYDTGVTPRIILGVLNGLAYSTFSNNRRVSAQDFRDVIDKLLQRADRPKVRGS